jgi:hypothetical protein
MIKKNTDVITRILKIGTKVVKRLVKLSAKPKKGFWARLFNK